MFAHPFLANIWITKSYLEKTYLFYKMGKLAGDDYERLVFARVEV